MRIKLLFYFLHMPLKKGWLVCSAHKWEQQQSDKAFSPSFDFVI